jgi:hypothetical protein
MKYESDDGSEVWYFWNSRDGVTPFTCSSPQSGKGLTHKDWGADGRVPDHLPRVGDFIWVDMSRERMCELAERMADEGPLRADDNRYDRDGWVQVFMRNFSEGEPDLVQATEEIREAFKLRAQQREADGIRATE